MASLSTRDHAAIRRWAGEHHASPALVDRPGGLLRFEFDRPPGPAALSWDDFFRAFDQRGLELVYDDRPGSRFHKLVVPESAPAETGRPPRMMAMQPLPPEQRPLAAPPRARPAARKRAAPPRQAGGSASGRVTARSAKRGKPAGKTTRKGASQRPSPSRRAA